MKQFSKFKNFLFWEHKYLFGLENHQLLQWLAHKINIKSFSLEKRVGSPFFIVSFILKLLANYILSYTEVFGSLATEKLTLFLSSSPTWASSCIVLLHFHVLTQKLM